MDQKLQLSELRALVNAFIDDTENLLDDLLKERILKFKNDADAIGESNRVPGAQNRATPRRRVSFDQMMKNKMKETSKQTGHRIEIVSFKPR